MTATRRRAPATTSIALVVALVTGCQNDGSGSAPGVSLPTVDTATSTSTTSVPGSTTTGPASTTTAPPSTSTSTTPPATTTTAPATTTTAPPTTTTTTTLPPPPAPCGAFPAIPAGALEVNSVTLDAIDDGVADDTATSYFDPGLAQWRLRLDLSSGSTSELHVIGIGAGLLKVLGTAQVDGGGADELLAIAGAGAATSNIGAFGADASGCLFRFSRDGAPFVAPVGATVTRQDGLTCTSAGLVLGHAEEAGGGLWEVSSTTLTRVSLTELSATASSIVGGVLPADVGDVATLDCPGITL